MIGRAPDNEVYIKSKFVSRHHAQIISDVRGSLIEDLNSTNGVFLNKKRISRRKLRDGDVLTLGVHELHYRELRAEDEATSDVDDEQSDENRAANDSSA